MVEGFRGCVECGAPLDAAARFCPRCGARAPLPPPPPDAGDSRRPGWAVPLLLLLVGTTAAGVILALTLLGGDPPEASTTTPALSGAFDSDGSPPTSDSPIAWSPTTLAEATTATTETVATATTSTSTTTTTTTIPLVSPAGAYQPYVSPVPPPSLPRSEGASGSGCLAGSDPLWDGIWFGYVEGRQSQAVVFNLACFYYGDLAVSEAAADGIVLHADHYIRNQVAFTWTLPLHPDAVAYVVDPTAPGGFRPVPADLWPASSGLPGLCPGPSCGVWLYLNSGMVTALVEYPE